MRSLQNPHTFKRGIIEYQQVASSKTSLWRGFCRSLEILKVKTVSTYMCAFFIVILRPTKSKRGANAIWLFAPRYRDADLRSGYDCLLIMWLTRPSISFDQCCAR